MVGSKKRYAIADSAQQVITVATTLKAISVGAVFSVVGGGRADSVF